MSSDFVSAAYYIGVDHAYYGNCINRGGKQMWWIWFLFSAAILCAFALGVALGKLLHENEYLKEENAKMKTGNLSRNEIAYYEDTLAILTDLRIRQQMETQRGEAVSAYYEKRLADLATALGEGRNNRAKEHPTEHTIKLWI